MKKAILILILLLLPTLAAADPVTDKVYQIVHYAEQYELGQITYAELQVYSNSLRSDIREIMGGIVLEEEDDEHIEGVSEEQAKKFFGEPTEYTSWVWLSNEEREIRLDEKMPRWEKVVYDGKKIQITFNGWPQVYKSNGEMKKLYWVDFDTRFKKQFDFNLGSMESEVKSLALSYLNTKSNARQLAEKLVEYSNLVHHYMEQNRENCKTMLDKFFSSSDKSMEQELIRWETVLYENDRFTLYAMAQLCESCEWAWAHIHLEPRFEGPGFEGFGKGGGTKSSYDYEELIEKDTSELLSLLKQELNDAKAAAARSDNGKGFNPGAYMPNLDVILRVLSENYNWDERLREENKQQFINDLDNILSSFGSTEKSKVKELRYEHRLVEDKIMRTEKWCREVQQEECAIDEGCINGECVFALGGDETCDNDADDDGDTLIDCRDPDCARQCGRLCKDVCESECWPCMNQCSGICEDCRDCEEEQGGEACASLCESECWPCNNERCWDQPICSECKACEEEGREEENCDMPCGPCKQCTSIKDPELCELECELCVACKTPDVNPECTAACERITEKHPEQLDGCLKLCNQNVVFYCTGAKQYSPCEDTTYICNGLPQVIPCTIYTCEGDIKQTVPCGEEAFCGLNQIAVGDRCKCKAGWYDCDKDGKSCESNVPCTTDMEICDDRMDNDDDLMIDCEDRMDCKEGMLCDLGKVCFDGDCVPPEEANVSVKCGENEAYKDGMCKCADSYTRFEGKCVPLEINITCDEGYIVVNGQCVPEITNETECPEDYILEDGVCKPPIIIPLCPEGYEDIDGSCVPIEVNITECNEGYELIEGQCVLIETECPEGFELVENECVPTEKENITECPEGFNLVDGKCVPVLIDCPQYHEYIDGECVPIIVPGECEEGFILKEGKCIPVVIDCPTSYEIIDGECVPRAEQECPMGYEMTNTGCQFVGIVVECAEDEVLEAGKCVSKEVYEGIDVRPEEIGRSCVFAEDCGSERAICSNGVCKEIPEEIYEREYGSEAVGEIVIPEELEETVVQRRELSPEELEERQRKQEEEMREEERDDRRDEGKGEERRDERYEEKRPEERMEERHEEERHEERREEPKPEERYEERREEHYEEARREEPKPEEREPEERYEEPQNEEPPREGGITGAFAWFETALRGIGLAEAKEKECSSNDDCNSNQKCDTVMGWCHCDWGWFDCNGHGDGSDDDGCESEDPTCGGERELCPGGCGENQYCDEKSGHCECEKGYNSCDGNWMTCESETRCKSCIDDSSCAEPICAEWDNVLIKFGCVDGEGWEEDNGVVSFSGGCNFKSAGKVDSYMHFDSWGEGFDEINKLRSEMEFGSGGGWCKFELENQIKERVELQKGLNEEFLKWFFDEYLASEPDKWENRIGGIFDIYWNLVDNMQQSASSSMCAGKDSIPSEYSLIDIEYESDFGKVHIWEEKKRVDEFKNIEILSPYMEIWIFPPKEVFKEEFVKAREGGYMPGPPEDRTKGIGPSAREKEEIRSNPEALKEFEDIAADFGGSLDGLMTIKDDDEDLFYVKATINPDVIFEGKPIKQVDFEPDVSVTVQLDFLYSIIKGSEQHGEVQAPPWDRGRRMRNIVSDVVAKGVIGAKVAAAIATGDIKVKPLSAVPKVLKFVGMAMEGDRPGGPGDRERKEED